MNVYFIYASIPREAYEKTLKYLLSHQYDFRAKGNEMRGLYAVTNNKKLMKEFFDLRGGNEMYTCVKKEMDKGEWKELSHFRFSDLLLRHSKYKSSDGEEVDLVVTVNEETTTKVDGEAYLSEFGPRQYAKIDYMIFSDSIIKALDCLGYTLYFDTSVHGSYDDERSSHADYNKSYNMTPYGRVLPDFGNEMNLLLFLYRVMFIGDEAKEVDKE